VKTGVILPSFAERADDARAAARVAEAAGVDGVFCYDHVWPMGQPERPAIAPFPLLGAIVAESDRLVVGPLVARVGLVPDAVLVSEFEALEFLAPGRVIAALGTGDRLSEAENVAYGVPYPSAAQRRGELRACAAALADRGVPVWVGAGAGNTGHGSPTVEIAEDVGVAVNFWEVAPESVAEQAARTEVTWAGAQLADRSARAVRALAAQLAAAGATWAVFGWPIPMEAVVAGATEGAAGADG